ncbi:hypothetical protein BDC45DRAFT_539089 [Circinella umbellata]|nr:hypothetical protein BDC45DRAFT_539089 [Circinella umbellata]
MVQIGKYTKCQQSIIKGFTILLLNNNNNKYRFHNRFLHFHHISISLLVHLLFLFQLLRYNQQYMKNSDIQNNSVEQERSQKIHLAKYFGVPEDLMYNDTLIHKRKKQDNENDTFKLKPQYKSKKPFTTNNEVDNNAIINSDLSSVSSYVTAPEKPIMDDDNDLKHKYCDEVIKKYGCSPGKVYVDKLRLEFKVKLPQQSAQLFCDEANCEAVIAIVEHFSLAQIRIIRDYFFVTLKLNGPKFRDHAKKLSETIAKIVRVPNRLTKMDDLHITVSKILIKDKIDRKIC